MYRFLYETGLFLLACFSCFAGSSRNILAGSNETQIAEKRAILQERKRIIGKLVKILSDKKELSENVLKCAHAIEILGEFRAVEAAPVLCKLLDYDCMPVVWHEVKGIRWFSTDKHLPKFLAVEALVKIGHVSLPAIVALIKKTEPEKVGTNFMKPSLAYGLMSALLGVKEAVAYLSKARNLTKKKNERRRLEIAIEKIPTVYVMPELRKIVVRYYGRKF